MSEHMKSVMWQRLDLPGAEFCALSRLDSGWQFAGVAVAAFAGVPLRADYVVECDESWRTRGATLTVVSEGAERRLQIRADGDGVWSVNGQTVDGVRGCVDVDLNVTPATNTLPIRRLNLVVGESAEVVAAWVRFPELTVEPLWQRYTRLSGDRYGYESDDHFTTEFAVDDLGLLTEYEGGWRRVSA
jgi:uncharacterized protein